MTNAFIGLTLGFMGSIHCIGMCGPIALALPVRTYNSWIRAAKYFTYNIGRVTTYAMMGLIFGMVGKGFAYVGLQQILSIGIGVLIVLSILLWYIPSTIGIGNGLKSKVYTIFKSQFQHFFKKADYASLYSLGVLNGLLPCGMLYIALLATVTLSSAFEGAIFMAAFGMGTLPMMFMIPYLSNIIGNSYKNIYQKIAPVITLAVGVMLIYRGITAYNHHVDGANKNCIDNSKTYTIVP
jgi:sulfite exporter TauE/SafE